MCNHPQTRLLVHPSQASSRKAAEGANRFSRYAECPGGLPMSDSTTNKATSPPTDNKEIARRFMEECWNQGKVEAARELLADDCRYHAPVFPSLTSGAENIGQ